MKWFFVLLVYVAFGLVFFVTFNGSRLDPYDASVWAWLFGWPLIMAMMILKWIFIAMAVILAIVLFLLVTG